MSGDAADNGALVVEYFYSLLSDWAYMGGERFEALARRLRFRVNYRPMKLAKLYANTGGIVLQKRSKQRQDYRVVELERWCDHLGIPITLHPRFYPTDDTLASCTIIAAASAGLDAGRLTNLFHRAIWVEEQNISDERTIERIIAAIHVDPEDLIRAARAPAVLETLERNTEEAATRGVFGSPFYCFGDDIFWGQDRLDFLDASISRAMRAGGAPGT
jgi:2-hydroxychromene-2-carboxylate isomerase